jgi:hypothetical protein
MIADGPAQDRGADGVLGPFEPMHRDGVRLDEHGHRLSLTAERDHVGLASGSFSRPSVGVRWSASGLADDIEFVGFAFTQFALPVTAGRDLQFDFHPAPGLRSPRAMSPLLARAGGRVALIAPIDSFHEQVIAVVGGDLVWGWHGDLDEVPSGFSATVGVYRARSVTEALEAWRSDLAIGEGRNRSNNVLSTHLSYWTDNGAAYWYRTEPDRTIAESVVDVVDHLRSERVPVRSVELDSWFYPHATLRPITEIGYPEDVPPTGASTWSPRADAFPPNAREPIIELRRQVGNLPLVLHARHIAPDSPWVTGPHEWWIDELAAHPHDPAFFRRWFDDAAGWGATCIEQDWMLMYWFGVRALRSAPGRAAHWQRALDAHAEATDVDLLWCMATPADLMLASSLERLIAVRTCDDYRFADDPALLWTWFLTVNRLAGVLGLTAFKDCSFSNPDVGADDDPIDGDRHAELEMLLAALSGGPVGIGDRIGRTNREIVMRVCDEDGRLRRVDRAIAAVDDCLFGGPARGERLMWATTTASQRGDVVDGDRAERHVWTYVVAINTATEAITVTDRFELDGRRVVDDWRAGTSSERAVIEVELAPRDWALFVVSPRGGPSAAAFGDPSKYVVVEAAPDPADR